MHVLGTLSSYTRQATLSLSSGLGRGGVERSLGPLGSAHLIAKPQSRTFYVLYCLCTKQGWGAHYVSSLATYIYRGTFNPSPSPF